jgi:hypothetical protein
LALDRSQLSDQSIYRFPTVETLASYIEQVKKGSAPIAPPPKHSILVTLKKGADGSLPPFFVIASAGGTLGAYAKLAARLKTKRDVIGVRDPFVWAERDPTMGFQDWVTLYMEAIRERQPRGPYYLGAYSSAASFGYEIALRLRQAGHEVALIALIDPLAIDCKTRRSFGYWALEAMFRRRAFKRAVLVAGWLRLAIPGTSRGSDRSVRDNNMALTREQFLERAAECTRNRNYISGFSALLELNTGLPLTLTDSELSQVEPDQYLSVLLARVKKVSPEIDPATIENILLQYYCLQMPAQHGYRLHRYDGTLVIFEPDGPHKGLLGAQFRPHVRNLRLRSLQLGSQTDRTRTVSEGLSERLRPHYLSMRDDEFVKRLSDELEALLR